VEVPVGFKWFGDGLIGGSLGFGGEESAGASFLRHDGTVWTTDKDGIILGLLAAEMTAVMGRDPGELYRELTAEGGRAQQERPPEARGAQSDGSPGTKQRIGPATHCQNCQNRHPAIASTRWLNGRTDTRTPHLASDHQEQRR